MSPSPPHSETEHELSWSSLATVYIPPANSTTSSWFLPNATEPVPASDLAPSNQTAIIGSALGGAFGGLLVVLLAFFVVRRRRQARRSAVDLDSEFSFDEVSTLASVHPFPLTAAPQHHSAKGTGHAYQGSERMHSHGIPERTPSRSGSVTSVTLSARPSSRIGSDDDSMNSYEKDPFRG
ncbi:hypothetical protein ONZ45_g3887 [Pleurotus djamor]|nr:hypothetical protein ONZ45_g3887 [Pleurotus djamor]